MLRNYLKIAWRNIFQLPVIEGDIRHALVKPNTVVVNETIAKKYFGTTHVLGKTIEIKDDKNLYYKITAVVKDIPANAHFHFYINHDSDNA